MENEEIKKAKKVLEEISRNERERRLTELRQKYIMNQNAVLSRGYDKGIMKKGVEQGINQERIEIVKKMRQENIVKVKELTEDEIKKII